MAGGKIKFGEGTYVIATAASLTVAKNNVWFDGQGEASLIQSVDTPSATNLILLNGSSGTHVTGFRMSNLAVYTGNFTTSGDMRAGIYGTYCEDVWIWRCYIYGGAGRKEKLQIQDSTGTKILYNRLYRMLIMIGQSGSSDDDTATTSSDVLVAGNRLIDPAYYDFNEGVPYKSRFAIGYKANGFQVFDNYIENPAVGIDISISRDSSVKNNTIIATGAYCQKGIYVEGGRNQTVEGNTIRGFDDNSGTAGIHAANIRPATNGSENLSLIDNTISNCYNGIWVRGYDRVKINDNTISSIENHGITVQDALPPTPDEVCTGGEIFHNIIYAFGVSVASSRGILITDTSTYFRVENNWIDGNSETGAAHCIFEAQNADHNVFKNNTLIGYQTAPIAVVGANSKIASYTIPFVDGTAATATGFDVDAAAEYAYAFGAIPDDCVEVQWIKIKGRAITTDGTNEMLLDIDIFGGADDEAYNAESYSADDVESDTVPSANDDIVVWTVTNAGVCGSGGLTRGDSFTVAAIGAPTDGTDLATDCHFQSVEIGYI